MTDDTRLCPRCGGTDWGTDETWSGNDDEEEVRTEFCEDCGWPEDDWRRPVAAAAPEGEN